MDAVWPYLAAILPTIMVAVLFYFLIKSMLEGDRRERLAQRRFEAEQDRQHPVQRPRPGAASDSGSGTGESAGQGSVGGDPASRPETPHKPAAPKDL